MKLIVQVPCYNEEETLPLVINSIPKEIPGVDVVETLIIDDGSTDRTIEVAEELRVDHIIRNKQNRGLAISFSEGIHKCLEFGADIIVNTDGDNQYPQQDIPKLIQPILEGNADIVVADRQTDKIAHFSPLKKLLQKVGSKVVKMASGTDLPDAVSGFRAYSREGAMALNIVTQFSYVAETIIQAGKKRIPITHVKVTTNPKTRESRLFKSIPEHIKKTATAIIRSHTMYSPLKPFLVIGGISIVLGLLPFLNFFFLMISRGELITGHLQSLIFGAVFMILGVLFGVMGLLADLMAINRKLAEDALYRLKNIEFNHTVHIRKIKENSDTWSPAKIIRQVGDGIYRTF